MVREPLMHQKPFFPTPDSSPQTTPDAESNDTYAGTFFLGRYRVVDEIGVGGMASVHLARVDGPGGFQKWVAIKRIHPHLVEDDSFVNMFLDEARIAAQISHPNVATVFELGSDDDTYWIAMEYLHGEPVREVMRRLEEMNRTMPPEIACRIIIDAAEGLHAAHELTGPDGIKLELVHRDVTPHNLFVSYEGVTKVVDFGIAKFSSRMSETRAGTLKGKIAYMSPEHVSGEQVDRQADIFGLGVVLWELTTGYRLFRAETDLDTLARVQECKVAPPSSIHPHYPPDLQAVVMKALAKSRFERYRSARELSRALQQVLVQRGLFVGNEEVSMFMKSIFVDRMEKREAHLRWAAEVTQTVEVKRTSQQAEASASSLFVVEDEAAPPPHLRSSAGASKKRNADEIPTLSELPFLQDDEPPPSSSQDDTVVTSRLDFPETFDEDDDNTATPARGVPVAPAFRQESEPLALVALSPRKTQDAPVGSRTSPMPAIPVMPPSAPTAPFAQPATVPRITESAHVHEETTRDPHSSMQTAAGPARAPNYAPLTPAMAVSTFPPELGPPRAMQVTMPITRRRKLPVWIVALASMIVFMTCVGIVLLWPRPGPVPTVLDPLRDARRTFSRALESPHANPDPTATTVPTVDYSSAPTAAPSIPSAAPTGVPQVVPSSTAATTGSAIPSAAATASAEVTGGGGGFLTIVCVPACEQVTDNGKKMGATPILKRKASIGMHRLHLMWSDPPGRKLVSTTVTADKITQVRESRP